MNKGIYCDEECKNTAKQILKYLQNHSDGKDTLEGIAEWWIESQYIEESVELVSKAVSYLCSQGILSAGKSSGMAVHYKLNATHDTGDDPLDSVDLKSKNINPIERQYSNSF